MNLTIAHTQKIIDKSLAGASFAVKAVKPIPAAKFSYRVRSQSYRVESDSKDKAYVLTIEPKSSSSEPYSPNALDTVNDFYNVINKSKVADMGLVPEVTAFDDSQSTVPFSYLLQPLTPPDELGSFINIPLSEAEKKYPGEKLTVAYTMLGRSVAAFNNIKNESGSFGAPGLKSSSGSWREVFSTIFRHLLDEVETLDKERPAAADPPIPWSFVRARFTLDAEGPGKVFDAVKEPKLVLFPTWTDDAVVTIDTSDNDPLPLLVGIKPRLDYALWADPLLEVSLHSDKINEGFLLGYDKYRNEHLQEGEGSKDIKAEFEDATGQLRSMWYNMFLQLFVLADNSEETEERLNQKKAAREQALDLGRLMKQQLEEAGLLDDDDDDNEE